MNRLLRWAAPALLLVSVGLGACGQPFLNLGEDIGVVAPDSVAVDLYLIGDAGLPALDGEPVLQALRDMLGQTPGRSYVVYLGDNVYPSGLPDSTAPYREEAERILQAQIDVLRSTQTPGVLIPGNHDWDAGTAGGWRAVVRQERYVQEHGGGVVSFLPSYGCPGPEVVDVGGALRLIVLDTQWWLHPWTKPQGPDSPCPADTQAEVVDLLRSALQDAGEVATVVVGHHPIASGGQHGGYFDWPTYLLPAYPWARLTGFADQDFSNANYRHMRDVFTELFSEHPPLVYAAGHEHNLQVLVRRPGPHLVVSGAGIYGHTTSVRAITGTQYANRASGFVRVSVMKDGRVRLGVLVVDADGNATEEFATWLRSRGGAS